MTGTHRYEFTATNAQEAHNLLDAAQKLLEAHMKLIAPGATFVRSELRERTPVRLTLHMDLGDANQVATLNEAMRSDAEPSR